MNPFVVLHGIWKYRPVRERAIDCILDQQLQKYGNEIKAIQLLTKIIKDTAIIRVMYFHEIFPLEECMYSPTPPSGVPRNANYKHMVVIWNILLGIAKHWNQQCFLRTFLQHKATGHKKEVWPPWPTLHTWIKKWIYWDFHQHLIDRKSNILYDRNDNACTFPLGVNGNLKIGVIFIYSTFDIEREEERLYFRPSGNKVVKCRRSPWIKTDILHFEFLCLNRMTYKLYFCRQSQGYLNEQHTLSKKCFYFHCYQIFSRMIVCLVIELSKRC